MQKEIKKKIEKLRAKAAMVDSTYRDLPLTVKTVKVKKWIKANPWINKLSPRKRKEVIGVAIIALSRPLKFKDILEDY